MTMNDNWALRHSTGVAIILLTAASVVLTLGFACALPLAAFATISALLFKRGPAIAALLSVWLANQVIGFTCLHYPADFITSPGVRRSEASLWSRLARRAPFLLAFMALPASVWA